MEVVLRGCGNSGSEGGKEGGSLLVPSSPTLPLYPEYTDKANPLPNECFPDSRVWMTDGPPPGGLTKKKGG
jgi:hypothetical protein